MERDFMLADVFTDQLFGGNPLAVFPDGQGLEGIQMQAIAAELNLSETAFLGRPEGPGGPWPLRIFTPKMELPFAGHPTIGTALAMAWAGLIDQAETDLIFAEAVGPVPVQLAWQDGAPLSATLTIEAKPEIRSTLEVGALAQLLGLEPESIGLRTGSLALEPQAVSMGVPFTLVPLRDRESLSRARLDSALWQASLADNWAPHLYLFAAGESEATFQSRMFAPAMGITEDPATGAAAAALGALLTEAGKAGPWRLHQGVEMGRPSLISLARRSNQSALLGIEVGGTAVKTASGSLKIPHSQQLSAAAQGKW